MTEITCECIGCEIVKIKDLIRNTIWGANASGVVIGISGGIDSAVACSLCCKAVSPERVIGVNMPVASNDPGDHKDAEELCRNLGMELITVPLEEVRAALLAAPHITDSPVLRGNMAARLRMITLYNIAAARGYLVCGTSNKTEYMIGDQRSGGILRQISNHSSISGKRMCIFSQRNLRSQNRSSKNPRVRDFGRGRAMKVS